MKNATEKKKINWKKVAALGGMFAVGVVVGVVGGEKVLGEIALNGESTIILRQLEQNGKKMLIAYMEDRKTGRKLSTFIDKGLLKELIENVTPLLDDPNFPVIK